MFSFFGLQINCIETWFISQALFYFTSLFCCFVFIFTFCIRGAQISILSPSNVNFFPTLMKWKWNENDDDEKVTLFHRRLRNETFNSKLTRSCSSLWSAKLKCALLAHNTVTIHTHTPHYTIQRSVLCLLTISPHAVRLSEFSPNSSERLLLRVCCFLWLPSEFEILNDRSAAVARIWSLARSQHGYSRLGGDMGQAIFSNISKTCFENGFRRIHLEWYEWVSCDRMYALCFVVLLLFL